MWVLILLGSVIGLVGFMDVLKYQYKKRHAGAWGGVRPNDGLDILYFEDQKMCKIKLEQWFE